MMNFLRNLYQESIFFNVVCCVATGVLALLLIRAGFVLSPEADVLEVTWVALLVSGVFYACFLFPIKGVSPVKSELSKNYPLLFLVASFTSLGLACVFYVLKFTDPGIVKLISRADVVFVAILSVLFLGERITARELFSCLLVVFCFFLLVSSTGEISLLHAFLVLLQGFLYALQSFLVKKRVSQVDPVIFSFLRGMFTVLLISVFYLPFSQEFSFSWLTVLLLALSQLFGFYLYRVFYFQAHKICPIYRLHVYLLLTPVILLFASYFVFDEQLTFLKLLGAFTVLLGVYLFARFGYQKKKSLV